MIHRTSSNSQNRFWILMLRITMHGNIVNGLYWLSSKHLLCLDHLNDKSYWIVYYFLQTVSTTRNSSMSISCFLLISGTTQHGISDFSCSSDWDSLRKLSSVNFTTRWIVFGWSRTMRVHGTSWRESLSTTKFRFLSSLKLSSFVKSFSPQEIDLHTYWPF